MNCDNLDEECYSYFLGNRISPPGEGAEELGNLEDPKTAEGDLKLGDYDLDYPEGPLNISVLERMISMVSVNLKKDLSSQMEKGKKKSLISLNVKECKKLVQWYGKYLLTREDENFVKEDEEAITKIEDFYYKNKIFGENQNNLISYLPILAYLCAYQLVKGDFQKQNINISRLIRIQEEINNNFKQICSNFFGVYPDKIKEKSQYILEFLKQYKEILSNSDEINYEIPNILKLYYKEKLTNSQ